MSQIRVVEVGPRDGLQNEPKIKKLPIEKMVETRVRFLIALADAGIHDVEAGAFVRADRIPQMARTDLVLEKLRAARPDLWAAKRFWVLVPNQKGLELALKAGAKHIAVFTATSDAFNEKNIQMSVGKSLEVIRAVVNEAKRAKLSVRGYISTVWGCPYSGTVPPAMALKVSEDLLEMGVEEISLGDTIGVATPKQVDEVLSLFRKEWPIGVHFHDTRGTAIANCLRAVERGIRTVDSSAGGLGGCPYAKGASGNLATEDLLYMLHGMGHETGISLEKVCEASLALEKKLRLSLPARFFQAWKATRKSSRKS